jgi:hypothetical protein
MPAIVTIAVVVLGTLLTTPQYVASTAARDVTAAGESVDYADDMPTGF